MYGRNLPAARTRIAQGRNLLEATDDAELHGLVDHADAYLAMFSGELERARDCYRRALANTDDYETKTTSMYLLGLVLEFLGDHDDAMSWHEKALALAESRGDPYARGCAQYCFGVSLWRRGESQRAEQLLRQALQFFSALNESWISTYCLEALAWIAGSRHHPRRAVVLMAAAAALSAAAGTVLFPLAEMAKWHDECERTAREQLDAAEFDTAWTQGSALTLDEAAAFALADTVDQCPLAALVEDTRAAR